MFFCSARILRLCLFSTNFIQCKQSTFQQIVDLICWIFVSAWQRRLKTNKKEIQNVGEFSLIKEIFGCLQQLLYCVFHNEDGRIKQKIQLNANENEEKCFLMKPKMNERKNEKNKIKKHKWFCNIGPMNDWWFYLAKIQRQKTHH